jgi:hypothetical protein
LEIPPWETNFENFSFFAIFEIPLTCSIWAFFGCTLRLYIQYARFGDCNCYL